MKRLGIQQRSARHQDEWSKIRLLDNANINAHRFPTERYQFVGVYTAKKPLKKFRLKQLSLTFRVCILSRVFAV